MKNLYIKPQSELLSSVPACIICGSNEAFNSLTDIEVMGDGVL